MLPGQISIDVWGAAGDDDPSDNAAGDNDPGDNAAGDNAAGDNASGGNAAGDNASGDNAAEKWNEAVFRQYIQFLIAERNL